MASILFLQFRYRIEAYADAQETQMIVHAAGEKLRTIVE
jgi:hypothetical protein